VCRDSCRDFETENGCEKASYYEVSTGKKAYECEWEAGACEKKSIGDGDDSGDVACKDDDDVCIEEVYCNSSDNLKYTTNGRSARGDDTQIHTHCCTTRTSCGSVRTTKTFDTNDEIDDATNTYVVCNEPYGRVVIKRDGRVLSAVTGACAPRN
jgi:hypothetical protein